MAKKAKSYSYVAATEALKILSQRDTTAEEIIYELLRIFAGFGDGQIGRLKDGRGNSANDGKTILVKNLVAYRPQPSGLIENLYKEIEVMVADNKISRHNPRLYVVSNGHDILAFDPKSNEYDEFKLELLWRDFEFFTPLAGIEKVDHIEEAEADVKSAELMAKLFDDIRRYNDIRDMDTVHALNIFMSRLLFCFFAEDTGLFPGENLFTNTLKTHTQEDGSDLADFIERAFFVMSTNDPADRATLPNFYDVFPYVNGGLFREHYPIPFLSRRARQLIINCGEYNWREINPDIFGSMIQAVVTPEQRAGLGMHYTSVPNIEKLIKPLFLDALEEEYLAACSECREKLAQNIKPERAAQRLKNLLARLTQIKFFDPACGSGNFLIISYKRVRELEIKVWKAIRNIANLALLPMPGVMLTQFYGIEIDDYACDTATLSLWLAEHQMNVKFKEEFGVDTETLPLKPSGHIVCGNACRLDWNTVCPHDPDDEVYIMGNPPYLGSSLQEEHHKEDMKIAIEKVCKGYKKLDYIAVWFIKAAEFCKGTNASFAFVTTSSISQGEQVPILWPILYSLGFDINFAVSSFKWSNNAKYNAGVSVVIIGMANVNNIHQRYIFDRTQRKDAKKINAYLIDSNSDIVYPKYSPLVNYIPSMLFGSKPADGGNLILEEQEYRMLLQNDKTSKFVKKLIGSEELIKSFTRYCLWIDDDDRKEALSHSEIATKIKAVEVFRLKSKKESTRELAEHPHRFSEPRYQRTDAIVMPSVSSERREFIPIGYVDKDTVVLNSAFSISNAEKWLFALLTSKMHNVWVHTVGGYLGTSIRYSVTLCYNTFPFPKLTTLDKKVLEDLAQNILDIRDQNFDMMLGEMYNPETMPDELRRAHAELDLAVERIYRSEPFQSDEERLEHLFKLYSKMTKK